MSAAPQIERSPAYEVIGANHDDGWHERRLTGVGSSEVATMLGLHPKHGEGGPAVLWAWKTGRQEPENLDDEENIWWGHRMEPLIIEAFGSEKYANRPVRLSGAHLRSTAHPWALTTLDGETFHPEHGWIPLEAKNVGLYQVERWLDGPPIEMWWQCQQHAFVTNKPCVSLAACVGGNQLMWEDVPRDPEAQRVLAVKGAEFWRCVREDRVPLHVPTLASVRALYHPGRESGLVQLPGAGWVELDERLVAVKRELRDLEKERARIEAKLKDAIGDHEAASLESGVVYTHRTQRRAEVTTPACEFKVMRRKAPKENRG